MKYDINDVVNLMKQKQNIRNICVVGHLHHGKTTLTKSLVVATNTYYESLTETHYTSIDKINKRITTRNTSFPLVYESNKNKYLINLIDTPGHVDFSNEVTSALRITDGVVIVIDCVQGVCVHMETLLRKVLAERVKPVLMINKVDRVINKWSPEEVYQRFRKIIKDVNVIISTYCDDQIGEVDSASVVFGSGELGWGFTLRKFAQLHSRLSNLPVEKMMKYFWGDFFYDPEMKKWTTKSISRSGKSLKRGFVQFCLEPVYQMFSKIKDATNEKGIENLEKSFSKLGLKLSKADKEKKGKDFAKAVMMNVLPVADAILEMIIRKLPSPVDAQAYRTQLLYTGRMDDKYAKSIKLCDYEGPLMMYVNKMIPSPDGTFIAFGRVFSGTIKPGQTIRIMGADYEDGKKKDLFTSVTVHQTLLMMGRMNFAIAEVLSGNIVGLVGIDKYINKCCTITDDNCIDAAPFRNMKYSVSPIVSIAVEPTNPAHLVQLVEGLKKLSRSDQIVKCGTDLYTGELTVSGVGELHLDICLSDLQENYCKGIDIKKSKPSVTYRETVTQSSPQCLSKSPNKHYKLFAKCEPLSNALVTDLEQGVVNVFEDQKSLSKILTEKYGWDSAETKRIWAFGPELNNTNVLVDLTKGVQCLDEAKGHIISAFRTFSSDGVLAAEQLRGCRFNLVDAILVFDRLYPIAPQLIPAARKVMYATQLTAKPRLVEPVYKVSIQTNKQVLDSVYQVINMRNGTVIKTERGEGTPIHTVICHIPVKDSFGLTEDLRAITNGRAFPQCIFDHWKVINEDPFDEQSNVSKIIREVRKRKGLRETIPSLDQFLDKL